MAEVKFDFSKYEEPVPTTDEVGFDFSKYEEPVPTTDEVTEESLSADPVWLKHAKTIYQSEHGEPAKKTDKKLAAWLKDRHSEIGMDLTSMGMAIARANTMSDKTKQAWIDSMEMYDEMGTGIKTVGRNIKNLFQDPTFSGPLATGFGAAYSGGRLVGARAASLLLKSSFKEQLKNSLLKKKVKKEAVEEFIDTGVSGGISKETLKQARKEAALAAGRWQGGVAGAWTGAATAASDLVSQHYDREQKDIDYSQSALEAAKYGIPTALTFGLAPITWTAFRNKKVLSKYEDDLKDWIRNEKADTLETIVKVLPVRAQYDEISSVIEDAGLKVMENGTVNIRILGSKEDLITEIIDDKMAALKKKTRGRRRIKKAEKEKIAKEAKKEANSIVKDTDADIIKKAKDVGITDIKTKNIPGGKILTGKKTLPITRVAEVKPDGRTIFEQKLGRIKRLFGAAVPQEVTDLQRLKKGGISRLLRAAGTRMSRLESALKTQYNVSKMSEIPEETREQLDEVLRGNSEGTQFSDEVREALGSMKSHISRMQTRLIKAGILKKGSNLETKIKKSQDQGFELWLNRQYEIYDNPHWRNEILKNPEKAEILRNAQSFLKSRFRNNDSNFERIDIDVQDFKKKGQAELDAAGVKKEYTEGDALTKLSKADSDYWLSVAGSKGKVNETISDILHAYDEDTLNRVFKEKIPPLRNSAGKILSRRGDIPEQIRALMGEYKDPFTNYRNSVMKINQLLETSKYERGVAELIKKGLIPGTGVIPDSSKGIVHRISSALPVGGAVDDPYRNITYQQGMDIGYLGGSLDLVKSPLDRLYANKDLADAIINGNEISIPGLLTGIPLIQKYLLLQGHTRAAKTVYSPTAIARNFIGAGWMAAGAGYLNPRHLKEGVNLFRGMFDWADPRLKMEMEKAVYLGYGQSGVDVNQYREMIQLAGREDFLTLKSPLFREKNKIVEKAAQFNMSATKFYQLMDDMWKQYAFFNEKGTYRKVLQDKGINPDEVVDSFRTGDDILVEITALDKFAARKVSQHMQNYAGVPQFVRYARLLPAADFLAFTTELVRTQYHILRTASEDIVEGAQLLKASGGERGGAQNWAGIKRLGSVIAAQSAAPALGYTSVQMAGMAGKAYEDAKYTIKDGMEYFNAPYERGTDFWYSEKPKNGEGVRTNIGYLNPWARFGNPVWAAIDSLSKGEDFDMRIRKAIEDVWSRPLWEAFGSSMLTDALMDLSRNADEYGRPIVKYGDSYFQQTAARVLTFIRPFLPFGRPEGMYEAFTQVPVGQEDPAPLSFMGKSIPYTNFLNRVGVVEGKTLRKKKLWHEIVGYFTGIKPVHYDIKQSFKFKARALENDLKDANSVYMNMIREQAPMNPQKLIDTYYQSLDKQYAKTKELFDMFEHAKSAGITEVALRRYLTTENIFNYPFSKQTKDAMFKGVFIPPKPTSKEINKILMRTGIEGGSVPPLKEVLPQLWSIYGEFRNKSTEIKEDPIEDKFDFSKYEEVIE